MAGLEATAHALVARARTGGTVKTQPRLRARVERVTHPLRMTSGTPCGPVGAAMDGPAPPAPVDPKLAGCSGGNVRLTSDMFGEVLCRVFL